MLALAFMIAISVLKPWRKKAASAGAKAIGPRPAR
jgi:hypothetical protein